MLCDNLQDIQEQQLEDELTFINQHINMRSGNYGDIKNQVQFPWYEMYEAKKQETQVNEAYFFTHGNNNEYFSQIGSKDQQDDSLFDQGEPFSTQNEYTFLNQYNEPSHHNNLQPQKELSRPNPPINKSKKKIQPQTKDIKSKQILKEQEYVYRRQKLASSNPTFTRLDNVGTSKSNNKLTVYYKVKEEKKVNLKPRQGQNRKNKQDKTQGGNLHQYLFENNEDLKQKTITQSDINSQEFISSYLQMLTNSNTNLDTTNQNKFLSKCKKNQSYYENQDIKQCTFKPNILKKSQQLVKNNKPVIERLSTSSHRVSKSPYQPHHQHKSKPNLERLEKLSQPRQLKTVAPEQVEETPSFRPNLSKKSLEHMSNCTYDVATRNKLWLQQKQEKLQKLRKEEEEHKAKKENCLYVPAITIYKGQQHAHFSRFGKQGMVEYFERVSMAKKKSYLDNSKMQKGSRVKTQMIDTSMRNKQNISCFSNQNKSGLGQGNMKKQTYNQAVRELHSKIMKLKI